VIGGNARKTRGAKMLISRHGSTAFHGNYHVDLDTPKVSWDSKTDCIIIRDHSVLDFDTYARHNYKITFELSEVVEMLNVLGLKAIIESPDEVDEGLAPACRALLRLVDHLGSAPRRDGSKED
jgi:hypothetical protein